MVLDVCPGLSGLLVWSQLYLPLMLGSWTRHFVHQVVVRGPVVLVHGSLASGSCGYCPVAYCHQLVNVCVKGWCTSTVSHFALETDNTHFRFLFITQSYPVLSHLQNIHRPTSEGSVCVDIRSVNQSSTSHDSQQESNDPSHSQSVHLQETPNTDTKCVVDVPEYTASGPKCPSTSTSQQNTPVELIHDGRPVESVSVQ